MVRQRTSPSPAAGSGASAISKSVGLGSPTGRLRSSTRRLVVAGTVGSSRPGLSATPAHLATARTLRYRAAMPATTRLAEFVVKTTLRDCPDAAVAQVRRAALDSIGVVLAGASEPVADSVRAVARAEGGAPLCTVLGTSLRTSATWAALANGTAGHAHDFDDTNFALLGHPSV